MVIWKKIFDEYLISSTGKIYSLKKKKILNCSKQKNGYITFKNKLLHRLVAKTFIPNLQNKPCVGHRDCKRDNNNINNLYWCTHIENMNHPITRKRISDTRKGTVFSNETKKKMSDKASKCIVYKYTKNNILVDVYNSTIEAALDNQTHDGDISRCCRGERKNT